MMREEIDGAGVEYESKGLLILHLRARRRRRDWLAIVGNLRQPMTLPLRLGLEAHAVREIVVGQLKAIVKRLSHGATLGVARLGAARLEQMKFAAVMRTAQRGRAVCAANA